MVDVNGNVTHFNDQTESLEISIPQKLARWLVSSLCSFSCLNLGSSLSARIVASPVRVSEK